jgi:hypothetical protein
VFLKYKKYNWEVVMENTIKKIVTHRNPHLDEIVAMWLLLRFKFPEVKIEFVENGNIKIGFSADTIAVGLGGGRFDEHPTGIEARKEGCAATLVAKYLEVIEEPALKKLLEYTVKNDLKGSNGGILDVAVRMKSMYERMNQLDVVNWVFVALDDLYAEQNRFFNSDFDQKVKITEIKTDGKLMKIATIESDSSSASKIARSKEVDIFIQKRTSGNIQIFSQNRKNLDMGSLARLLRIEENRLLDLHLINDWKAFEREEKINKLPQWYFHRMMGSILNGSLTATGVPPTKISLEKILEFVILVFSDDAKYLNCKTANQSQCKKCENYKYGFHSCRKQRAILHTVASNAEKQLA